MDLDASLKKHGSRLDEIEQFVGHIKGMMSGADENVARATDQVDGLLAFKVSFEKALPDLEKAIKDVAVVVDDVGKIKADLAPVLAWIAEQQKAADDLKAARKATDEAMATAAAKARAGHDEPGAPEPASEECSETEQPVG